MINYILGGKIRGFVYGGSHLRGIVSDTNSTNSSDSLGGAPFQSPLPQVAA